ncbi:Ankyrin repeat-containing protein [Brazilian cedratvirus IHUMI]|uniref:Ankyrin repeat-containing protein n=1 Tax=Brazilian cedratvirus IHUMI TaxID=2126980 RepID=A0A2R8FFC8_9VIRU|nr:Ankyrin repeat-containing protein [Brazilian cedratvirus IHUMI]
MQQVYWTIFSYSGVYNYLNQQVCTEFADLIPKVSYAAYLNMLCERGRKINTGLIVVRLVTNGHQSYCAKLAIEAAEQGLLCLLSQVHDYLPKDPYLPAVKFSRIEVLKWAKTQGYKLHGDVFILAGEIGDREILQ